MTRPIDSDEGRYDLPDPDSIRRVREVLREGSVPDHSPQTEPHDGFAWIRQMKHQLEQAS